MVQQTKMWSMGAMVLLISLAGGAVGCEGAFDSGRNTDDSVQLDAELTTIQRAWSSGAFQGSLGIRASWEGGADLDLFVGAPTGEVFSYKHRNGSRGGVFTKNACQGSSCYGQTSEEVSWLRDAPAGTYRVWVERYDNRTFEDLVIEVSRDGALEQSFLVDGITGGRGATSETFQLEVASEPELEPEQPAVDPDAQFIGVACSVSGQSGTCQRTSACGGSNVSTPGHCPGPGYIQCCTAPSSPTPTPEPSPIDEDPEQGGVCDPANPPRPNTDWTEAAGDAGCPDGMARITDFCVDRYEASLVEVFANGEERSWSPYKNPGSAQVRAVSVEGAVPQGYINANQAANACAASGKRLCSDREWLRACQGASGNTYPYGQTARPGACNEARSSHPVIEYFGTAANWIWSELGNSCINQLPNSLAKTGEHEACVTGEGVFDMMGNVHEWTSASSGTFRGGFYVDTYRNGTGCNYRTTAHNRAHWDYSTGFRCCADAF